MKEELYKVLGKAKCEEMVKQSWGFGHLLEERESAVSQPLKGHSWRYVLLLKATNNFSPVIVFHCT